jgi:hypothetical protein
VEVVIDLHHQGTPLDANGDMITGSTLWPNATATADALGIRPQFDQVIHRSKQAVSILLGGLEGDTPTSPATRGRRLPGSLETPMDSSARRRS